MADTATSGVAAIDKLEKPGLEQACCLKRQQRLQGSGVEGQDAGQMYEVIKQGCGDE